MRYLTLQAEQWLTVLNFQNMSFQFFRDWELKRSLYFPFSILKSWFFCHSYVAAYPHLHGYRFSSHTTLLAKGLDVADYILLSIWFYFRQVVFCMIWLCSLLQYDLSSILCDTASTTRHVLQLSRLIQTTPHQCIDCIGSSFFQYSL